MIHIIINKKCNTGLGTAEDSWVVNLHQDTEVMRKMSK